MVARIAAWLVFAVASPADASQSVTAIPFASFADCEKRQERVTASMLTAAEIVGPDRRPVTIKPYCTNVRPTFWIEPREAW